MFEEDGRCTRTAIPATARCPPGWMRWKKSLTATGGILPTPTGRCLSGALEQSGATLKAKLDGMDEKLDAITEKVNTLAEKPAKRWESIVGYALSALVGAFLLWLASGLPGLK